MDFIFPKYCVNCKKIGSYLCENCFSYLSFDVYPICLVCNRPTLEGLTHKRCIKRYTIDGTFSAIAFKGTARKLVYQFKYKPFLTDLKTVLTDLFYEALIQNETFKKIPHQEDIIFVPVPLYSSKLRKRGYNQAEILAIELGKRFGFKTENLLERIKDTKTQVGLKRDERIKNIKSAFNVVPNIPISKYLNILLVDDVLTTGSTLSEAARILKKAGAKRVYGLTLAKD